MEYDLLLEKMKKKIPVYGNYGNQNLSSDLTDIRIITKNQNRFKKSTLYLSATMLLPDPSTPETITIFCYGDIIDFSKYKNSSFRILYFGQEISQAELFNFTSESMTDIPQVSMGMHILVNALFSGNGLQHLVDAAAEIFGNPVYVVDLQHKYLAISSGIFLASIFLNCSTCLSCLLIYPSYFISILTCSFTSSGRFGRSGSIEASIS